MTYSYYAVFEYSSEEEINRGIYPIGVYFPDFLGCVSGANDVKQALEMAKEVLLMRIEDEIDCKKILPSPSDKKTLEENLAQNEKLFKITVIV